MTKKYINNVFIFLVISFLILPNTFFASAITKNLSKINTSDLLQPKTLNSLKQNTTPKPSTQSKTEKIPKTTQPKEEKAAIYLNFEKASLSSVVNYLAEQKKINIIPNSNLDKIQVSLTTRTPFTLEKSWNVLLTLLELNAYTIIEVDNLYRIVKSTDQFREPLPIYSSGDGIEPENLPDSDLVVRYIYFLQNIGADTISPILESMMSQGKQNVINNKALDALIITDKCLNIKAALKIIKELDEGGLRESIKMITLKHVDSVEVKKLFTEPKSGIIPQQNRQSIQFLRASAKKTSTYFSQDTKIITYTPKNTLILLGTEKSLQKIVDFIYKYIDVPLIDAKSRLHIKELKYSKAETVANLLNNGLLKAPAGQIQNTKYKYFEDVIIRADSAVKTSVSKESSGQKVDAQYGGGNRLIIACNNKDWKRLEKLIDKLDKPKPQIAFEVMVLDLTIKRDKSLGAQFKPKHEGLVGKGTRSLFANLYGVGIDNTGDTEFINMHELTIPRTPNASTITLGKTTGDDKNLWAVIQAIAQQELSSIIAQPFVVVNNHVQCELDFNSTRWVNGSLDRSVGTELSRKKVKETAHNKIFLTPHVNKEGLINLEIDVDISAFKSSSGGNKGTRKLLTRVNIATGEVLILGGLTKSDIQEKRYKIPILGDIPLLGNLFKGKTKTKTNTDLYIFIRPSVIKPNPAGLPDEYTRLKLDYAKYRMIESDVYHKDKDPIQRWFFRPQSQTIKQRVSDAQKGIFRPLDQFACGHEQPRTVEIKHDPYYRAEEALKELKQKEIELKEIVDKKRSKIKYRKNTI